MTPKQKLQKDRAYFKFVISGLPKPIQLESLTSHEVHAWKEILRLRDFLLEDFEVGSIELGLNIPEHRCWCGKEAKHYVEYHPETEFSKMIWTCKKHITNARLEWEEEYMHK